MNTVSMHFALPLGRQLFTALRWLGLVALACAGVNAREPEVAELRFDRRFAAAETLATVVRPAWLSHIEQAGGQFLDEPPSWQVAASAPSGAHTSVSPGMPRPDPNPNPPAPALLPPRPPARSSEEGLGECKDDGVAPPRCCS